MVAGGVAACVGLDSVAVVLGAGHGVGSGLAGGGDVGRFWFRERGCGEGPAGVGFSD